MNAHVIANPVPTPEEMGEILGLTSERVKAVRRIMTAPAQPKPSRFVGTVKAAKKKSRRAVGRK